MNAECGLLLLRSGMPTSGLICVKTQSCFMSLERKRRPQVAISRVLPYISFVVECSDQNRRSSRHRSLGSAGVSPNSSHEPSHTPGQICNYHWRCLRHWEGSCTASRSARSTSVSPRPLQTAFVLLLFSKGHLRHFFFITSL